MAGIYFSKFSNGFKALFDAAIEDKIITADEFQRFSAADQAELSRQLAGKEGKIGDIIVIQKSYNSKDGSTLDIYAGTTDENGTVDVPDNKRVKERYPDVGKKASFNNGVLTLLDKNGKVLLDALGNPIKIDFTTGMEIDSTIDNVQGSFEIIEGENFQRTNRRFAIALIRSMFDKVISENQEMLTQLGLFDASLWREGLGMGIQKVADSIDSDQKAIIASTQKKIEQMLKERDNICSALEKQLDNPSGFSDEFSKLVGGNFNNMNFEQLRESCHNKDKEKDATVRYNKTVSDFKEMYPDNKISKYLDGNLVTQTLDKVVKLCDGVADIWVMLWATGGIGKILGQASMKTFVNTSKLFLENVAKKDYKAALSQFSKMSTFMNGAVHSASTMSTFEGGKAFINSATNNEDLSIEEILSRTVNGFLSGAEMGVEMSALQTFAIGPIMNKLTPVLNKMTGATSKVSALLSKNGSASMEEISKIYDECIQTTRGTFAKEGLHFGVSLPVTISGFTTIDSARAFLSQDGFNEEEFRAQLKANATSDEERKRIGEMDSTDLKIEFLKENFNAQLGGMTTIEGVSLIMRRYQAARLAGEVVPKPINNLLGAKINTVEKDGKTLYEVVTENNKTLNFDLQNDKNGNTVSKFSSPEKAIAAYQALCLKTIQTTQETETKNDATAKGVAPKDNTGKKPHVKPEIYEAESSLAETVRAPETKVDGNGEYRANNSTKNYTVDDVKELFNNTNGELRSNGYTNTIFDEMPWDLRKWVDENPRLAYQHLEMELGFSKHISDDVYSVITKVLNSNNGKYKQLLTDTSENALGMRNIDMLATVLMYAEHKGTLHVYINAIEKNPEILEVVLPGIIGVKNEGQAHAIMNYKGSSNPINESLSLLYSSSFAEKFPWKKATRSFAKNPDIPEHINNLTTFLAEHPMQTDAVLYRAEQYNGVLRNLKFDLYDANGNIVKSRTNLSDELQNLVYKQRKKIAQNRGCSVDDITIDDVKAAGITLTPENCPELRLILKSMKAQKASLTQERFTSTTLDVNIATHWADTAPMDGGKRNPDGSIIYAYNCQKGTEGAFINNYDVMSNGTQYNSTQTMSEYPDEIEILIQRNSIQTPVRLEFKNGHWIITTDIETNGKKLEKICYNNKGD